MHVLSLNKVFHCESLNLLYYFIVYTSMKIIYFYLFWRQQTCLLPVFLNFFMFLKTKKQRNYLIKIDFEI